MALWLSWPVLVADLIVRSMQLLPWLKQGLLNDCLSSSLWHRINVWDWTIPWFETCNPPVLMLVGCQADLGLFFNQTFCKSNQIDTYFSENQLKSYCEKYLFRGQAKTWRCLYSHRLADFLPGWFKVWFDSFFLLLWNAGMETRGKKPSVNANNITLSWLWITLLSLDQLI